LKGKPFALIGINSDPKNHLRDVIKKQEMTWRSWWDGGDTSGPIATQWNIHGWPTIYVLDHKGVIRVKEVRGEELDKAVDGLLAELEKSGQSDGKNK
jgi:hypothetical protein